MDNASAVFLIVNRMMEPDYEHPWKRRSVKVASGSGFGIRIKDKKYIVTNAHVADHSMFLECIKFNSSRRYELRIVDLAPSIDLAVLSVLDENYDDFWSGVKIADIGRPSNRGEVIYVVGFPLGGLNPSVTQGIVSRIVSAMYSRVIPNLAIQVDSAINPGNSGGPAFNAAGAIIGIAFSHTIQTQNMCYIIPSTILTHFIEGIVKFGKFPGLCSLGIRTDELSNPGLRKYYLQESPESGILVTDIEPGAETEKYLRPEDVIHEIDGIQINNDKSIFLENYGIVTAPGPNTEKFAFWYLLRTKHVGDQVRIRITRTGKQMTIQFKLLPPPAPLLPALSDMISHLYYIFAGIVFCSANHWMFPEKPKQDDRSMFMKYLLERPAIDQIVIVPEILTTPLTSGYNRPTSRLVSINSETVRDIKHVYQLCESLDTEFVKFEFEYGGIIIVNTKQALEQSEEIAQRYLKAPYHNFDD